jgi:hypothetical protein
MKVVRTHFGSVTKPAANIGCQFVAHLNLTNLDFGTEPTFSTEEAASLASEVAQRRASSQPASDSTSCFDRIGVLWTKSA